MKQTGPLSPLARGLIALFFLASGALPILAAFDVGPVRARDINGPPWLGLAAGGIFALAGIVVLVGEARHKPPLSWLVAAAGALILVAFAAIGNWIAFGPGPRACSAGIGTLLFSASRSAGEWECRIAFGIGAIALDGLCAGAALRGLGKLAGPGRLGGGFEKLGDGLVFLGLLPILLPLLLFAIVKSAATAFAEYRRTGKWPRNEAFIARMKRRREDDG
ncbi:MAG: hypothetical protein R3E35_01105 [Rhodocyclaceae bacterium]